MKKIDYLLRAGFLITMEDDEGIIEDGAVAVKGNSIVDVGKFSDLSSKYDPGEIIGGKDHVMFPGLINTHTHAAMVYFRGIADDLPLKDWLEKHIWPNEMKWLTAEFVRDAVELAFVEMIKAGVTTYTDMYFYEDEAAKRLEDIGMRAVLGSGIIDFPWKGVAEKPEDYFTHAERMIKDWKGSELITPCIAPHAVYTCGPENYKRSREMADKYDVPLHTHLAETEFEVSQCREKFGKTPVEHLDSIGFLCEKVSAAHCVWLTEREIEILAERKVGVCHCIESNLKLASGIAPVPALLKAGVKVGFGTDGAASNNDLNILGEMSTAAKVHKVVSRDATVIDSKTALLMATKYGAEIIGLGDITGSIKTGKRADLVLARLNKPHLVPLYNIYSHIVYSMHSSDIETVMINGRLVMKDNNLLTIDEEEVINRARSWQKKIKED